MCHLLLFTHVHRTTDHPFELYDLRHLHLPERSPIVFEAGVHAEKSIGELIKDSPVTHSTTAGQEPFGLI